MKKWLEAEVVEVELSNTQYGGATITEPDDVFVNSDGKWEATFIPS